MIYYFIFFQKIHYEVLKNLSVSLIFFKKGKKKRTNKKVGQNICPHFRVYKQEHWAEVVIEDKMC